MNPQAPLDLYCERLTAGLWAEPLNALSNLVFLIVALLLWRRAARPADKGLAVLVALVGAASMAFHLYATVWARWLDLLFIEIFIYAFLALYARRIFAFGAPGIIAIMLGYALFEWLLVRLFAPGAFNASYVYFPALIAMSVLAVLALRRAPAAARYLGLAAGIFLLAIVFRSVDLAWCESWPWGTHFIWHMLNAAVLYFSAAALHRRRL